MLRSQVLNHGIGTALAESVVVFRVAYRVRTAFDRNDVTLGAGHVSGELIEGFLRGLGQVVFVETEMNGGLVTTR